MSELHVPAKATCLVEAALLLFKNLAYLIHWELLWNCMQNKAQKSIDDCLPCLYQTYTNYSQFMICPVREVFLRSFLFCYCHSISVTFKCFSQLLMFVLWAQCYFQYVNFYFFRVLGCVEDCLKRNPGNRLCNWFWNLNTRWDLLHSLAFRRS